MPTIKIIPSNKH